MRFVCAVVGFVATLAMGVQAQESRVKLGPPTRYVMVQPGCPGSLTARQSSGPVEIWTGALEDRGRSQESDGAARGKFGGLGIQVEFESANVPVNALELRVSYLPQQLRYLPVDPKGSQFMPAGPKGAKDMRESRKTFDLAEQAAMHVDGNLWVGPASTIKRVHLLSVTYANGSVWRAPSEDACSVEPDGLLLVGAK